MRHKNSPFSNYAYSDPDEDESAIGYNEWNSLMGVDPELILSLSQGTANPYLDLEDNHRNEDDYPELAAAPEVLFYYTPTNDFELIHDNYVFMQWWMYEPSSHTPHLMIPGFDDKFGHEGDWEMYQFTIRLRDPDKPHMKRYWIEPFTATASQHYYGQTILWDRKHNGGPDGWNQDYVFHANDGDRVKIYIAENAHATYFREGMIDSDFTAGCGGTQCQYNGEPTFPDWDQIDDPELLSYVNYIPLKGLNAEPSKIFGWKGRWGQTCKFIPIPPELLPFPYDIINSVLNKDMYAPESPGSRKGHIIKYDSPDTVDLSIKPDEFHFLCRKELLKKELELR